MTPNREAMTLENVRDALEALDRFAAGHPDAQGSESFVRARDTLRAELLRLASQKDREDKLVHALYRWLPGIHHLDSHEMRAAHADSHLLIGPYSSCEDEPEYGEAIWERLEHTQDELEALKRRIDEAPVCDAEWTVGHGLAFIDAPIELDGKRVTLLVLDGGASER